MIGTVMSAAACKKAAKKAYDSAERASFEQGNQIAEKALRDIVDRSSPRCGAHQMARIGLVAARSVESNTESKRLVLFKALHLMRTSAAASVGSQAAFCMQILNNFDSGMGAWMSRAYHGVLVPGLLEGMADAAQARHGKEAPYLSYLAELAKNSSQPEKAIGEAGRTAKTHRHPIPMSQHALGYAAVARELVGSESVPKQAEKLLEVARPYIEQAAAQKHDGASVRVADHYARLRQYEALPIQPQARYALHRATLSLIGMADVGEASDPVHALWLAQLASHHQPSAADQKAIYQRAYADQRPFADGTPSARLMDFLRTAAPIDQHSDQSWLLQDAALPVLLRTLRGDDLSSGSPMSNIWHVTAPYLKSLSADADGVARATTLLSGLKELDGPHGVQEAAQLGLDLAEQAPAGELRGGILRSALQDAVGATTDNPQSAVILKATGITDVSGCDADAAQAALQMFVKMGSDHMQSALLSSARESGAAPTVQSAANHVLLGTVKVDKRSH